jgi:hypothetical protein
MYYSYPNYSLPSIFLVHIMSYEPDVLTVVTAESMVL